MNLVLPLPKIDDQHRMQVGGKGFALAEMAKKGLLVPEAICVTTGAYNEYVRKTGLRDQIILELYRKAFEDMRWEEIWDTSLRIRSLFIKTPMPPDLRARLAPAIQSKFLGKTVSVRSSAPGEDSSKTSFAGLHESFVNVSGEEAILDHIRLVWASLWSDRALLYRQELGLDVEKSAMAVIIQEMAFGERSGVVFGKSPVEPSQAVVEAVYGLNQGLVDGTVEPDRWILNRKTGGIISHTAAIREKALSPAPEGVRVEPLAAELRNKPPLEISEISAVFGLAMKAETFFGSPQDVEWTYRKDILHALQARPITTGTTTEDEERHWYLSLHRSFDNLKELRKKIEKELIPAMEEEASQLAQRGISGISDVQLADEIEYRQGIHERWLDIYKQDCIPFAHGMRLFGQVYNDVMRPKDPFEFMDLLVGAKMVSIERNEMLEDLASWIRQEPELAACLKGNRLEECDASFQEAFDAMSKRFGDLTWSEGQFGQYSGQVVDFIIEMASRTPEKETQERQSHEKRLEAFLSHFEGDQRSYAMEMIDIARASYRFRDDDNTYLGKIEGHLLTALNEGRRRIGFRCGIETRFLEPEHVVRALRNWEEALEVCDVPEHEPVETGLTLKARQLVGQPAGAGIAFGKARVVLDSSDLFNFKSGEILVCDAVDPNMTFVVPLAAGIVERRGGMLIHGAIIAREYGIPCVTGVADAANLIRTGDRVTVDGHLGIVIIGEPSLKDADAA
ncbi:MAG: PEP/pyruvate-binding domain-containing protein [Desulfobacteraceae bacterium]